MRPRRTVPTVSRPPVEPLNRVHDQEHPLLGMPRRDTIVTAMLALATIALFALMATDAGRDLIQPIDDAFLRWMVSLRTGWLTVVAMVFNLIGVTYVMAPIRLGIAAWLAVRRRWWHFAAFVSAIVVSEISIGYSRHCTTGPERSGLSSRRAAHRSHPGTPWPPRSPPWQR